MRLRQTCSVLNVYRVNKDHMCSLRGWSKYTYSVMFVYLRGDRTDVYVTVLVVCVKFMYCSRIIRMLARRPQMGGIKVEVMRGHHDMVTMTWSPWLGSCECVVMATLRLRGVGCQVM